MKGRAIHIHQQGETANMTLLSLDCPPPASHEVQIQQAYSGVNFVDIYFRKGLYPLPSLPAILGVEAVGFISAVGAEAQGFKVGDRVAYAGLPTGSYASIRNLAVSQLIHIPDNISDGTVAGVLLRGITAHMLFNSIKSVKPGDSVFIHAAAGGLGLVLVQWLKSLGAYVMGTVGSQAKADLARAHGLDHAILYRERNFVDAVFELTQGRGVDYAIDGIGGETLRSTLKIVRPEGMLASIGQVGGEVDSTSLNQLCQARNIEFSRPSVMQYMRDHAQYQIAAKDTLERLSLGLSVKIDSILPLEHVALAHQKLESGLSHGSILLDTQA